MKKKAAPRRGKTVRNAKESEFKFHPAKIDSLFEVLDAIAQMDLPDAGLIAQYANIDPRTAGKLLKNAETLGLAHRATDSGFVLPLPYPHKGSEDQKRLVVREALMRHPILTGIRVFLQRGDNIADALRKSVTVNKIRGYDERDYAPLLEWATSLKALTPGMTVEDLIEEAVTSKEERESKGDRRVIAFLSHSSKDKPFIRQLAGDLTVEKIGVWIDEQRILPGESIPGKIAQGLAASDFFLIAISRNSVESAWVQKELDSALVHEIERRRVTVIPLKLDETPMPNVLKDKKYIDFSKSYRSACEELVDALRRHRGE